MVNIGENILESSETNFMNLPPQLFDVNHVAKMKFWLSITVPEMKVSKITAQKTDLKDCVEFLTLQVIQWN